MAKVGKPSWFKLFLHNKPILAAAPDEAVGVAVKAAMEYFESGVEPQLDPFAAMIFSALKGGVDESIADYQKSVEAGKRGGRPPKGCKPSLREANPSEGELSTEGAEDAGADAPPPPAKKPSKHKYGEYTNVLLTDEELDKLKAEYADWDARIERLSAYIASTGKAYKSHYATIRNWARKDAEEKVARPVRTQAQPQEQVNPFLQYVREHEGAEHHG